MWRTATSARSVHRPRSTDAVPAKPSSTVHEHVRSLNLMLVATPYRLHGKNPGTSGRQRTRKRCRTGQKRDWALHKSRCLNSLRHQTKQNSAAAVSASDQRAIRIRARLHELPDEVLVEVDRLRARFTRRRCTQ